MRLTKFERWMLRRIFRRAMAQSPAHPNNIRDIYSLVREAARKEFYEDNDPTLNLFLQEQFAAAQQEVFCTVPK